MMLKASGRVKDIRKGTEGHPVPKFLIYLSSKDFKVVKERLRTELQTLFGTASQNTTLKIVSKELLYGIF